MHVTLPAIALTALCAFVLSDLCRASEVFQEKGGLVVLEAESTASSLGRWKKKTDVADYTGECHLEFTGNSIMNGPPGSPLKYSFQINKAGTYRLVIRGRKRLETERDDLSNDCYVQVSGKYEAGGGAPLNILKSDTKMFGGHADRWGWAVKLDRDHKKYDALYNFEAGQSYKLTISGRSKNFNIDRILFVHEDVNLREQQSKHPPESARSGGSSGGFTGSFGSRLAPSMTRELKDRQGRVIQAKLVDKKGDKLVAIVQDRSFEIPVETLADEDQAFIKEWKP